MGKLIYAVGNIELYRKNGKIKLVADDGYLDPHERQVVESVLSLADADDLAHFLTKEVRSARLRYQLSISEYIVIDDNMFRVLSVDDDTNTVSIEIAGGVGAILNVNDLSEENIYKGN